MLGEAALTLGLLLACVDATCYNYWDGDFFPDRNASSYCQSLIIWPVSDAVLNDSILRDATAIDYYQEIYSGAYANGEVNLECLGVLQYMACALSYPTCADGQDSIQTVCSWLCELMANRCGTTTRLYRDACLAGAVASANCASGSHLLLSLLLLLFLAGLA